MLQDKEFWFKSVLLSVCIMKLCYECFIKNYNKIQEKVNKYIQPLLVIHKNSCSAQDYY